MHQIFGCDLYINITNIIFFAANSNTYSIDNLTMKYFLILFLTLFKRLLLVKLFFSISVPF